MIVTVNDKYGHQIWLVFPRRSLVHLHLVGLAEHVRARKQMIIDISSTEALRSILSLKIIEYFCQI